MAYMIANQAVGLSRILRRDRNMSGKRNDILIEVIATVLLIAIGFAAGMATDRVTTIAPYPGFHYTVEPHNPLSYMASWDAVDYISIARHGYSSFFWVNWFPLYPMAISLLDHLSPSVLISALIVSWASLVGAIYFYIKIVRRIFKFNSPWETIRAELLFVLFPTGVFLIAPFSESLFAFLSLSAIYFALQKRYLWAALLAMGSTATHITGVFVVALIGLILLEEHGQPKKIVMMMIGGGLGLFAYMTYLYVKYQKPLGFITTQRTYHNWTSKGWSNLITSASLLTIASIIAVILSAVYWWNKRKSFSVYSLLFLSIPIVGHQYGGFNRYILMAFPIPLMIYGYLRNKSLLYSLGASVAGMLWMYVVLQYAAGYIGS